MHATSQLLSNSIPYRFLPSFLFEFSRNSKVHSNSIKTRKRSAPVPVLTARKRRGPVRDYSLSCAMVAGPVRRGPVGVIPFFDRLLYHLSVPRERKERKKKRKKRRLKCDFLLVLPFFPLLLLEWPWLPGPIRERERERERAVLSRGGGGDVGRETRHTKPERRWYRKERRRDLAEGV